MELCAQGKNLEKQVYSTKTRLEITPVYISELGDGIERQYINPERLGLENSLGIAMLGLTKHLADCKKCHV